LTHVAEPADVVAVMVVGPFDALGRSSGML
jgi:hypothetical protein